MPLHQSSQRSAAERRRDPAARAGLIAVAAVLAVVVLYPVGEALLSDEVQVGSKAFTESVILGDVLTVAGMSQGRTMQHRESLGGTMLVWLALKSGDIDIYPEYTGTLRQEIFAGEQLASDEALRARLAEEGVLMSRPLGFSNNYALGMREDVAQRLGITKFSDLKQHPDLRYGFSNEFVDREDGWRGLRVAYGLSGASVEGLEHELAYRSLVSGHLDVTDVYTTDATIKKYDLRVLEDDLGFFPKYDAVWLYCETLPEREPELVAALEKLSIDDETMREMNKRVDVDRISERRVAADFVNDRLGASVLVFDPKLGGGAAERFAAFAGRLWNSTQEHLVLVGISLGLAILIAVPLGVVSAKSRHVGWLIVGIAEIIQTIPGLALLVLLASGFITATNLVHGKLGITWFNLPPIGPIPAIAALFMYSLLPIIRNTKSGLESVPGTLRESAAALGLGPWARLRLIELPMASPIIMTGIKTTAVINVGYAALGGLIAAGGYGEVIMSGLRKMDVGLMLEGAIPAALLALAVKWSFEFAERYLVPQGLRLKGE